MKHIKTVKWLKDRLGDKNVRIVDCTYQLGDPSKGRKIYEMKHIPGAIYFGLGSDLSGEVKAHGGRHPLPDMETFKRKLEAAGIGNHTHVIAYDGGEGCFASRFWWLMTYAGHEQVFVLDGGMKSWEAAGLPVTDDIPEFERAQFEIRLDHSMLASYEEVKKQTISRSAVLIDSRAKERYLGIKEPLDRIPGHIPGAINCVWTESFEGGRWKSPEEQKKRFSHLKKEDDIIVYCGSGVSATPNIIALLEAGFEKVKLYAGSYSDWVSYPENEVEKGNGQ
ncbi:thiosulfate/3-mercaptopyruvate sulfurtransferase [Bacillus thermophilus]|uniref:Thiosulfate/3-mercaptopyruvate sulfurtransferase n=1 Tax=Siminovitchia thermophila TaxID=1245522 RepID=A0ABS2R350_9BACI|nr:sulfurtransferase [Siminovitchia thermophila]MBM7713584.1 thiosulfate/3-mercaptopyruvate sulfurtransferase [Siminovitchia thermophila]